MIKATVTFNEEFGWELDFYEGFNELNQQQKLDLLQDIIYDANKLYRETSENL